VAHDVALPAAPQERVEIPVAEAVDGLHHLALEGQPAHLAVRDDVQPRLGLTVEHFVDGGVLRGAQLVRVSALARGEQLGRTQEAADDVRARVDHDAAAASALSDGRSASRFEMPKAATSAPASASPAETSMATRKESIEAERSIGSCWSSAIGWPWSP